MFPSLKRREREKVITPPSSLPEGVGEYLLTYDLSRCDAFLPPYAIKNKYPWVKQVFDHREGNPLRSLRLECNATELNMLITDILNNSTIRELILLDSTAGVNLS